jgi:hypothetical protein
MGFLQVFGEKTYLSAAYGCADVIWRRGLLKKGYGLCHGVSGNAYALMAFYLYTKVSKLAYFQFQFPILNVIVI